MRHHRLRQHQHLLLAARQRLGGSPELLLQHRKEAEDTLEVGSHLRPLAALAVRAEREVVLNGQLREELLALLREGDAEAHHLVGGETAERPALEADRAAKRDQPGDRTHRRRLPGAVPAKQRDELAFADVQRQLVQHREAAVGHPQIADLKHPGLPPRPRTVRPGRKRSPRDRAAPRPADRALSARRDRARSRCRQST